MTDDGRDPTMLANPRFWSVLAACIAVWALAGWLVIR